MPISNEVVSTYPSLSEVAHLLNKEREHLEQEAEDLFIGLTIGLLGDSTVTLTDKELYRYAVQCIVHKHMSNCVRVIEYRLPKPEVLIEGPDRNGVSISLVGTWNAEPNLTSTTVKEIAIDRIVGADWEEIPYFGVDPE